MLLSFNQRLMSRVFKKKPLLKHSGGVERLSAEGNVQTES